MNVKKTAAKATKMERTPQVLTISKDADLCYAHQENIAKGRGGNDPFRHGLLARLGLVLGVGRGNRIGGVSMSANQSYNISPLGIGQSSARDLPTSSFSSQSNFLKSEM
jgi:hypothetical protein